MTEPTLLERLRMILRTLASIVVWVVAILIKIVRGLLPGDPGKQRVSPSIDSSSRE